MWLKINIESTAPPVNIYVNADTLSTDFGSSYQWYLDGNPIPGATSQTYEATTSGNFTVDVTFANGCTSTSMIHVHSMTSIEDLNFGVIQLYPNPAHNQINIAFSSPLIGSTEVLLIDPAGRVVISDSFIESNLITLNVSDLDNGFYYLKIKNNGRYSTMQFVKTHK